MMVSIVVAMASNHVIGLGGTLPWQGELPGDMRFFKSLTMGHPIVMGRRTYESIGKPLPGRTNIVLSTDIGYTAPGCIVIHSIPYAMEAAVRAEGGEKVFVIGGASLYRNTLEFTSEIFMTLIHQEFPGDTFFPGIGGYSWEKVVLEEHPADDKNRYARSLVKYSRHVPALEVPLV